MQIGINGRFFPTNWRPAINEIDFAHTHGFSSIQFRGGDQALTAKQLGAELTTIHDYLATKQITAVMELLIKIDEHGLTEHQQTPLEVFLVNLPAIQTLPCRCVHMHLVPAESLNNQQLRQLEYALIPQFATAVEHAQSLGIQFGFEHNEPAIDLFAKPEICREVLEAVPNLHFVWDTNHTQLDDFAQFQALFPRLSMVHVSDTHLTETNEHLPLGLGNLDLKHYCQALLDAGFRGQMILEIGGLPKSGGFGRDTDAALIDSHQQLSNSLASI